MHRRLRILLCSCVWASVPLLPVGSITTAHAQGAGTTAPLPGKDQAKRLFEQGVDLEKKADYAAALTKYREAEQIAVTAGLRFHKGYCLEMTGKLTQALEAYETADKLAREQNKQDVRAAIMARLGPLRARAPQVAVRIASPPEGIEVHVDGVRVAGPLLDGKAFRIDPGEHTVVARAPWHRNLTRRVETQESATTIVDISLDRVNPTPAEPSVARVPSPAAAAIPPVSFSSEDAIARAPATPTEPPFDAARGRSHALPILTSLGTTALAGAGVVFFLAAADAQQDGKRDCITKTTCNEEQARVRTFDALALGSFIGAAGLGVLALVLWTSQGPQRTALGSRSAPPRQTRASLRPATLGVEGTF